MTKFFSAALQTLIAVMIFLSVAGCSGQVINPSLYNQNMEKEKFSDGAWLGPIAITGVDSDGSNMGKDGLPIAYTATYLVAVCDGKASFWWKSDDGRFNAPVGSLVDFKQSSNREIYIISSQHHDLDNLKAPDWFETQVMLLVEVAANELRAQVSRAVINPNLPETDRYRNFIRGGVGILKRVSKECPRDLMKTISND